MCSGECGYGVVDLVSTLPEAAVNTSHELERQAVQSRQRGDFDEAATLFAAAADATDVVERQLHLQIRQACCLWSVERGEEAADLAIDVAQRARTEGVLPELADALGLIVDHYSRVGRLAEGAVLLSQALDVLEQLPKDPSTYQVAHNLAATLEHSGFYLPAIELFTSALELAPSEEERLFTLASMASPHHYAAALTINPAEKQRIVEEGLAYATADVARECHELLTASSAAANRAMLLVHIGDFAEALVAASDAQRLAEKHGLQEDSLFAVAAETISTWRLFNDPGVLPRVSSALRLAERLHRTEVLAILHDVEVEVLWSLGRFDDARKSLESRVVIARRHVAEEREVRWQHVQLGVEHLRMEQLSTSDALTGLHNRRHLDRVLPALLASDQSVVVGAIDLDGFKRVNDELGYAVGDQVLQEVATLLAASCRRGDPVVRLGGDEFVVVLRQMQLEKGLEVFERMRRSISEHHFEGVSEVMDLGVSIGVLALEPGHDFDLGSVLAKASGAMQQSKRQGRNRVTVVDV